MLLAGLDIETTGLDHTQNHRLIQIGLCIKDTETQKCDKYVRDVRPVGDINISLKALQLNGFTLERIGAADTNTMVDAWFNAALHKDGYKPDTLIPVGWNVVAFDREFIQKEMPAISKYFTFANEKHSTRAIDLTALGLFYEYKTGTPYAHLKKTLAEQAAKTLGRNQEHDALYDAEAALLALDFFRNTLKEY